MTVIVLTLVTLVELTKSSLEATGVAYVAEEITTRESQRELFLGLVGASGTELHRVETSLDKAFANVGYFTEKIKLSDLLYKAEGADVLPKRKQAPEDERIYQLQDAGNALRLTTDSGAAIALIALEEIRKLREDRLSKRLSLRCAYILNSLKHPEEVDYLRKLYGTSFILISAFSPREMRKNNLATRIAASRRSTGRDKFYEHAERIMNRDEKEDKRLGQSVGDTFPKADLFVEVTDERELEKSVNRFVELYFGNVFITPRRDELAMFQARAAALRSADLGRQVGAVITTPAGNVVAVGTNEVPKAGGGLYWEEDAYDDRDFRRGYDINVTFKRGLFGEIIEGIQKKEYFTVEHMKRKVDDIVDDLFPGTQLSGLLEFGRSVHAEMAAIVDAAYRGVSVRDCTLYTTTFPCHLCAKHIVASGIKDVVYIQPFPKSRTSELYLDSGGLPVVNFRPFVGIAPRKYMMLFEAGEIPRKDEQTGYVKHWVGRDSSPRYAEHATFYSDREITDSEEFQGKLKSFRFIKEAARISMSPIPPAPDGTPV